mmetsp:Transcript_29011/g.27983  ORF Transcript_29011/g.27983 Transcript_29011/m.27983 type:complete len:102 (+) Transcript_29011:208-513(+)
MLNYETLEDLRDRAMLYDEKDEALNNSDESMRSSFSPIRGSIMMQTSTYKLAKSTDQRFIKLFALVKNVLQILKYLDEYGYPDFSKSFIFDCKEGNFKELK